MYEPGPNSDLEVISEAECLQLLERHHLGRIAVVIDGQPLILPVNYALSHRIWSPDSASIALPLVGEGGVSQIFVIRADGSDFRRVADGTAAFWSP